MAADRHSHSTTKGRQSATPSQDQQYQDSYQDDWQRLLDAACTTSALVANRLAGLARLLDEHDREIGGLGADVALCARMAANALRAAELQHEVAEAYAEWLVEA